MGEKVGNKTDDFQSQLDLQESREYQKEPKGFRGRQEPNTFG